MAMVKVSRFHRFKLYLAPNIGTPTVLIFIQEMLFFGGTSILISKGFFSSQFTHSKWMAFPIVQNAVTGTFFESRYFARITA